MTQVRTRAGVIEGFTTRRGDVFRGIPFAEPPVEKLRFRPPAPKRPWTGVRQAVDFGPSAPQWGQLPAFARRLISAGPGGLSQDCLYLNVWTPKADAKRRPVMVWIHGGAFTMGSGSTPLYSGSRLAARGDVVVVTINYRLGALGFLNLRSLAPGQPDAPANLGLRDQMAALEWVRDNIDAFGGDPENVTIFGESAGGMSVGTLLGTPRAEGLFHRAICQSGAAHNVSSQDHAALVADVFVRELGVEPGDLEALQAASVGDIMRAQSAASLYFGVGNLLPWQPSVDGDLLPTSAIAAIRSGLNRDVPVLVGSNRDEWKLFTFGDLAMRRLGEEGLAKRLAEVLPGKDASGRRTVELALEVYGPSGSRRGRSSASERWSSFNSDLIFHYPAAELANLRAETGARTYTYLFTYLLPVFGRRLGACHGLEIPFVFGTMRERILGVTLGNVRSARELSRQMQRAWVAFARTGRPDHDRLPDWPAYAPPERATMIFDRECRVEPSRFEDVRRFFASIQLGRRRVAPPPTELRPQRSARG